MAGVVAICTEQVTPVALAQAEWKGIAERRGSVLDRPLGKRTVLTL